MNKAALIIGVAAFGTWYYLSKKSADTTPENWLDLMPDLGGVADSVDSFTGGFMKISAMRNVTGADLYHPNIKAFLQVIRKGEGTDDVNGYRRIFGGQLFSNFADHPRITVKKSGYTSTAAGAYQFIISSWDETKNIMGLRDFSPVSQDLAAVGRIMARGALDDVKAGRFDIAVKKCAKEWASLPFSPYGQPTISLAEARNVYLANAGTFA